MVELHLVAGSLVDVPQLTVADVLALPEVQAGQPVVLAGRTGLTRAVRWVHVLELSEVEGLLRGGELVLTTGIALPTSNDGLRRYIGALDRSRVSGVLLQLGERWVTPPAALLAAADRVGLPVVGLPTQVPFVAITESVHASILSSSYAELQASERLYELFARRGTDAAPPRQVVQDAAELAGAPVVLETLAHRVLEAALAGRDAGGVLGDWESRSRRATTPTTTRSSRCGPEGWVVRPVSLRGEAFGRLVLLPGPDVHPSRLQVLAVERAAEALAVGRLLRGDGPHLEGRAEAELLANLVERRYRSEGDAHLRNAAAGVPTARRTLTGLAVATPGADPQAGAAAVVVAARKARVPVLTAPGPLGVSVLVPLAAEADVDRTVGVLADAFRAELPGRTVVVGRGPTVDGLADVAVTLAEAAHAASAGMRAGRDGQVVTLADVGVHGLLAQWGDDGRLQAYVERQLGPLLDGSPGCELLLATLRAFLEQGGNKSSTASALHVSRPALYARLEQVAVRLGVDLDDVDVRLSLHLALTASDRTAPATAPARPPTGRRAGSAPSRRTAPGR